GPARRDVELRRRAAGPRDRGGRRHRRLPVALRQRGAGDAGDDRGRPADLDRELRQRRLAAGEHRHRRAGPAAGAGGVPRHRGAPAVAHVLLPRRGPPVTEDASPPAAWSAARVRAALVRFARGDYGIALGLSTAWAILLLVAQRGTGFARDEG